MIRLLVSRAPAFSMIQHLFRAAVFEDTDEPALLQEFFGARRGTFADIGANTPQTSVSGAFEARGWKGIVVEPLPECAAQLRAARRCPIVEAACTSPDKAGGMGTLHIAGAQGAQSSLDGAFISPRDRTIRSIDVPLVTLDSVLTTHGIEQLDFLSLDTEGTELDVLEGIDLSARQVRLVLLEDHARDFSKHRYMTGRGYRLCRRTGFNSWYVPTASTHPAVSVFGALQLLRKYVLGMPARRLRRWRHERQARRGTN